MTRDDCMWVAYRCTGLVLIVIAVVMVPQLVSTVTIYNSSNASMGVDLPGLTLRNEVTMKAVLVQAIVQVALPAVAGMLFLFRRRGGGAERMKRDGGQVLRGEV